MTTAGGATAPTPNGIWFNKLAPISENDQEIDDSQYTDYHHGNTLNVFAQTNYLQYYYATDFTLPPSSLGINGYFSIPGVSSPAMPL